MIRRKMLQIRETLFKVQANPVTWIRLNISFYKCTHRMSHTSAAFTYSLVQSLALLGRKEPGASLQLSDNNTELGLLSVYEGEAENLMY